MELREAVGELTLSEEPQRSSRSFSATTTHGKSTPPLGGPVEDVVLALERLGFPAERARQVVSMTVERIAEEKGTPMPASLETGELLRLALTNIQ